MGFSWPAMYVYMEKKKEREESKSFVNGTNGNEKEKK